MFNFIDIFDWFHWLVADGNVVNHIHRFRRWNCRHDHRMDLTAEQFSGQANSRQSMLDLE